MLEPGKLSVILCARKGVFHSILFFIQKGYNFFSNEVGPCRLAAILFAELLVYIVFSVILANAAALSQCMWNYFTFCRARQCVTLHKVQQLIARHRFNQETDKLARRL